MKFAPIVLFVYNRPTHTKRTIECLLNNEYADCSDLYIFSDQAKLQKDTEAVRKVRECVNGISGFKNIYKVFHSENKGLAKSIIEGITEVFKKHDSVIVLEDDLESSPNYLSYMNKALAFYSPNDIWSIAGYTPNIEIPGQYSFDTYIAHRNCSWGWATWKQNWEKTDWQVKDFKQFFISKKERRLFERGGNDLSIMLLKQQQEIINSWSIRFNYAAYKNNLPSVYPCKSFIKNIGVDGSGTNMKKSAKYNTKIDIQGLSSLNFCPVEIFNPDITKNFKLFYNTSIFRKTINWCKIQKALLLLK